MEKLLQLLNGIAPLSPALEDHLKRIAKKNSYKKRSYLLQEGQMSKYIHYVESGLLRCFHDNKVKEINIWFMPAGNVIVSVESFFLQEDSYQYIQALEDCITWSITYQELQDTYRKYPEFNLHRAVLAEKYYVESSIRQR